MKRRELDKLLSKAIISTCVILAIMFGLWLVQKGYTRINFAYFVMPKIMIGVIILFLSLTIFTIYLAYTKDEKYFELSSWFAGITTLSILLKINYQIKGLEFILPTNFPFHGGSTVKFYPVMLLLSLICIVALWIMTLVKVVKK